MNKTTKYKSIKMKSLIVILIGILLSSQMMQAMANSTDPVIVTVSNLDQLKIAIENAQDGDVIGFKGQIEIYDDVVIGDPDKHIILKRIEDNSYLSLSYSESPFLIQNITFDGAELSSNFSFISISSDATFQDVTIKNVVSPMPGGAVSIGDGEVYFKDCTFDSNSSMDGSHIRINSGKPTHIENCTFTNGHVTGKGGAIMVASPSSTCTITSSIITGNSSDNIGGGIYNSGVLIITDSKVYNNTASNGGSDIANDEFGRLTLPTSNSAMNTLFASDNITVKGWTLDFGSADDISLPGNIFLKLNFEAYTPPVEPDPTPTTVLLDSASLGTADNEKITGLTAGKMYKVSVDGTTNYTNADGTLTTNEAEVTALEVTEIVGLINGVTYLVKEYIPPVEEPIEEPTDPGTETPTDETPDSDSEQQSSSNTTTTTTNTTDSNNTSNTTTTDSNNTNTTNNTTTHNSDSRDDSSTVKNYDYSTHSTTENTYLPPSNDGSGEKGGQASASQHQTITVDYGNIADGIKVQDDGKDITINVNVNVGTNEKDEAEPQIVEVASSKVEEVPSDTSNITWVELVKICLLFGIFICVFRRPIAK